MSNQIELHQIITGDGLTYNINDNTKARYLLSSTPGNWGLPPVEYVRTRSYQQDGESELAFYLQTRRFSISVGAEGCSRPNLWQLRQNLLNACRPNRSGQLTYVFRSGTLQYAILGRALSPNFPSGEDEEWYEWGYRDEIEIEAVQPWWYAYQQSIASGAQTVGGELTFPITFDASHIYFGSGNTWGSATINYTGTWYAYPLITIHGAGDTFILTHVETGYRIAWLGSLSTGQTLTIDLRNSYDALGNYLGVQIYDNTGANQFNYIDPESNLLMFRIEPDGVVSGGVNTFVLSALNTDSNTTFSMTYNTALIGI